MRNDAMIAALRGEKAEPPPVADGDSEPPHWMEDEEIVESSELLYAPDDTGWLVETGNDETEADEGGDLALDVATGVSESAAPATLPELERVADPFRDEPPTFSLLDMVPGEREAPLFNPLPPLRPLPTTDDEDEPTVRFMVPPMPTPPRTRAAAAVMVLLLVAASLCLLRAWPGEPGLSLSDSGPAVPAANSAAPEPYPPAQLAVEVRMEMPEGHEATSGAPSAPPLPLSAAGGATPGAGPASAPVVRRTGLAPTVSEEQGSGSGAAARAPSGPPPSPRATSEGAGAADALSGADQSAQKSETPSPAEGEPEFDAGHAKRLLSVAAALAAQECSAEGGSGRARVSVTFSPSGRSTVASLQGGPFAGTATGSCIASKFRGVAIAPFGGGPRTVTMTVVLP